MREINFCRTCVLYTTDQNGTNFCQLIRQPINLDNDFCSKHQSTLAQCEVCHQYLIGSPVIKYLDETQSEFKLCCQNCSQRL